MIKVLASNATKHFLSILRDKNTKSNDFRNALEVISLSLAFELSNTVPLEERMISTPVEDCTVQSYSNEIVLLPIMRAGVGMLNAFTRVFPDAIIEYQVLQRDESTQEISTHYTSYKHINENSKVFILDPMLATGNTTCAAVDSLLMSGAKDIAVVSVLAAPQGVENVLTHFPNLNIYTASLDEGLTAKSYIRPGLGDAGNRIHGK